MTDQENSVAIGGLFSLVEKCHVSKANPNRTTKMELKLEKNSVLFSSRLSEGKEPLPFEMYCALRKWLQADGSNKSIFGHCFLTS